MKKTTTHEKMLEFVYEECTADEKQSIETRMLIDNAFYDEIMELKFVKELIDKSELCPKISTLKNILAYSYSK